MTDRITLIPLYGLGPFEPVCYFLEFGGCRILLDCGWDYRFSDNDISNLKKIGNIDCILISHSTIQHLGALPYAVAKLGISCPIYATLPTLKMGLMLLYDAYQSIMSSDSSFSHFSIDDVDHAFNMIVPLKYLQSFRLTGNGEGIKITPMNSGHVIGGTVWKISRESDDVFYAIDFNHKTERHLNGLYIETVFRPSLLIADCLNFDMRHSHRNEREALLIEKVSNCLSNGGDVLIPTDASGRSLELLFILNSLWKQRGFVGKYSLVFLSHTAKHTIDFANSMLEWMSDSCQKEFNKRKHSPFDFESLRICTKASDLEFIPKPRVILATNPFLENGFSQEIFFELAPEKKNLLVLTQRAPPLTIAGKLYENPKLEGVDFKVNEIEQLKGEELDEYIQFKRETESEMNPTMQAKADPTEEIVIIDDDIIFDKNEGQKKNIKKRKLIQLYPMFPYKESRVTSDEYGESVNYRELFQDSDQEPDNDVLTVEFSKESKKFIKRDERNKVVDLKKEKQRDDERVKDELTEEKLPIPVKTVTKLVHVDVKCSVLFIDFEGRSDGASSFNIVSNISPRKLILLHGNASNAAMMKKRLTRVCGSISCPKISYKVDVTSQSAFFKAVLSERLAQSLQFSRPLLGHKVASFSARLGKKSELSGLDVLESLDTTKAVGEMKKLEKEDHNLFLGNPKLIDVKRSLTEHRIDVELSKGTITCGPGAEKLTIKKLTSDCIYLCGNVSENYYRTRKALYNLLEVV